MMIRSLLVVLALGCAGFAQDAPPERPGPGGGSDAAKALVERIKRSLTEVNEALLDAADSDTVADEFDRALVSHRKAIRDIQELIEQIEKSSQQSSGGGGGGQQQQEQQQSSSQSQSSPSSRPSDGQNAPDPSEQQREGESQGGEQEQPEGQDGEDERNPSDEMSNAEGSQQDASGPPPEDPTAPFTRTDTDGRWGLMPPKLQERLMNLHVNDVPTRYRRHLDAYIRAINAQADGDR